MKTIFLLISALLILSGASIYAQNKLQASIAGKTGGTITAKELLDAGKLIVSDDHWLITSYRFSAYAVNRNAIEIENSSDTLSPRIKEVLPTLPAGTKIYFEYIKAKDVTGLTKQLPALAFTLH
jgi:undecaprenyl pyrophosphate synthase